MFFCVFPQAVSRDIPAIRGNIPMTLILSLEGRDGIVLASDSRATNDAGGLVMIDDSAKKLFRVSKSVGVLICGDGGIARYLVEQLTAKVRNDQDLQSILKPATEIFRSEYEKAFGPYVRVIPKDHVDRAPPIQFILAGYASIKGAEPKPITLFLDSQTGFGPKQVSSGFGAIGVAQQASYFLTHFYDRGLPMTRLRFLAAYTIAETAALCPQVGGPIRLAEITLSTGFRELSNGDMQSLQTEISDFRLKMKGLFHN